MLGKVKDAPIIGHTIPRLELWTAVLAVEVAELVVESGLAKGYTEADIVDGIIRATPAASGIRNYKEGGEDLDLANLQGLMPAHYNEKSATELY